LLYGVGDLRRDGQPLVLVEGEFDVVTLWQEARGVVDAASILGAGNRLRSECLEVIACYPLVLVAYDSDGAGQRGAKMILEQLTENGVTAVQIHVPFGGDVNGFHQNGGDLRNWLKETVLRKVKMSMRSTAIGLGK
jgi:DNA primase